MKPWTESTFVFISTNPVHDPGGVEERWLDVMADLTRRGSTVRFLCLMGSPVEARARALRGVQVDPYILDKWNVIRSRSRLRKYLRRYDPVCAHSTGVEADLLLRWAARKVPGTRIAHTVTDDPQRTRRLGPIDALMRRFDEFGMRRSDAVFAETPELVAEIVKAGVAGERVVFDPDIEVGGSTRESVARHVDLYQGFMHA